MPLIPRSLGLGPTVQQAPLPVPQEEPPDPYAAMIAAQIERMNVPRKPMYTPEQVAERRSQNEREYQLGLLGTLSGNAGLGEAGGLVLKNALAQRQPKVTERGVADPISGEFTYDPDYLANQEQAKLQSLQQLSAAAGERRLADRRHAQDRRDLLGVQLQGKADLKALGTAMTAEGVSAADARRLTVEDRMADDFVREVKTHKAVVDSFGNLNATAQKGDAASDMAFIFQYMKMLDPSSVVREGEFASAQNAAGVPERILNMYNRARSGNFLSPGQRTNMLGTAGRLAQVAQGNIDQATRSWTERAQARKLDPFAVTGTRAPAAARPQQGGALPPGWSITKE